MKMTQTLVVEVSKACSPKDEEQGGDKKSGKVDA